MSFVSQPKTTKPNATHSLVPIPLSSQAQTSVDWHDGKLTGEYGQGNGLLRKGQTVGAKQNSAACRKIGLCQRMYV